MVGNGQGAAHQTKTFEGRGTECNNSPRTGQKRTHVQRKYSIDPTPFDERKGKTFLPADPCWLRSASSW